VEQYSLKLGVWTELPGMPTPRAELAAAILGNDLYVMGGCSAEGRGYEFFGMSTPRVEALNLPSCSWTRLPSMLIGRNGCASAVLGGVVYILGGVDHHDVILNTVERFNPCDAGWKHGPPMHTFRSCCCAAVIHNRIYVAGGHDEWDREVTGLEMFDPIADAWFSQPAMSTPRRIFQLVVAQPFVNNVFAFGGANFYCLNEDDIKLNSVAMHDSICEMDELVFNQVGNTWAMDDSMWYA
jgi:kelch-like protein 9/13